MNNKTPKLAPSTLPPERPFSHPNTLLNGNKWREGETEKEIRGKWRTEGIVWRKWKGVQRCTITIELHKHMAWLEPHRRM